MRNKEVEDRIRKSIDIESRDFLDKLLEYPVEKRRKKSKLKYIKWGINLGTVCIFVFALFLTRNIWNGNQNLSPNEPTSVVDNIQFNEVEYDNKIDSNETPIDNNKSVFVQIKSLVYVNKQFDLKLKETLFSQYDHDVSCYLFKESNEVSYCNIILSKNDHQSRIQIGIKKQELPIFTDESINLWEQQENFINFIKSQINTKEITLVKNNTNNLVNYKTKFKIGDLGIAVDSYEIEKEEFVDILKIIIDNFK